MTRKYEVFDRFGNRVDDDDDVLRDGQRLVVPLRMADSQQREVIDFAVQDAARRSNYILDQATRRRIDDVREAAYQEYKQSLADAWKTPAGRGQQPGDQCTINGQPGHLNHRLECVADRTDSAAPRMMTADAAQRIKDAAYAEMVADLTEAWKTR